MACDVLGMSRLEMASKSCLVSFEIEHTAALLSEHVNMMGMHSSVIFRVAAQVVPAGGPHHASNLVFEAGLRSR